MHIFLYSALRYLRPAQALPMLFLETKHILMASLFLLRHLKTEKKKNIVLRQTGKCKRSVCACPGIAVEPVRISWRSMRKCTPSSQLPQLNVDLRVGGLLPMQYAP